MVLLKRGPVLDTRQLKDLTSVGPATIADLHRLGIHSVAELASKDGRALYKRLCEVTGVKHDICCLDVFRCAIAQACCPELPVDQKKWWYWAQLRKKKLPVE
jgi:hypothetical protein